MRKALLIGIGNPGPEYAHTFHNMGAAFVTQLAEADQLSWKQLHHIRYATRPDGLVLGLTDTFMNESGRGVRELIDYLKHEGALIIAHDDTDQALGAVLLKESGGSGGHNGIRSIQEVLGDQTYWRLKIGARPERFAGTPHIKSENFVLNKLGAEENALLKEKAFPEAERLLNEFLATL